MINNAKISYSIQLICLIWLILFAPVCSIFAASYTQVGRYLTASDKPLLAQVSLLSQTVQVHFSENVQTVGQAMEHILQFSGYKLADRKAMSSSVRNMLDLNLPLIDRTFGPMTLQEALQTLAGKPYRLLTDRVHRLVSFQLKPTYRG